MVAPPFPIIVAIFFASTVTVEVILTSTGAGAGAGWAEVDELDAEVEFLWAAAAAAAAVAAAAAASNFFPLRTFSTSAQPSPEEVRAESSDKEPSSVANFL